MFRWRTLTSYRGAPVRFFPALVACRSGRLREFIYSRLAWARWLSAHMKDYDLLHVHGMFSYPSTIAMRLARRLGQPYLSRPHGMLCEWSLRHSALRKKIYLGLAERANLEGSLGLTCTAEQECEEARPARTPRCLPSCCPAACTCRR